MINIPKETIDLAAKGDMAAFEEIYKSFSPMVYTVALRVTGDSLDAEEATQDVFVKVFRGLKGFRFDSSFGTWIYRITMNTAINIHRSSSRRRGAGVVDYDGVKDSLPDTRRGTGGEIEKSIAAESIGSMLDAVSPKHRSCLVLREIEGLNYKEISDILRIPLNTVRSRLKRARAAIAAYAKEREACP